jgi:hypothetical protein
MFNFDSMKRIFLAFFLTAITTSCGLKRGDCVVFRIEPMSRTECEFTCEGDPLYHKTFTDTCGAYGVGEIYLGN